jgi:hypothetical protein
MAKIIRFHAWYYSVQNILCYSLLAPYKDWDTQNCNFVCCFVRVWNLVANIEWGT